jgi:hypothetical protein
LVPSRFIAEARWLAASEWDLKMAVGKAFVERTTPFRRCGMSQVLVVIAALLLCVGTVWFADGGL